jgi:hypothetical protein
MKNITFSAQAEIIDQARKVAAKQNRTLNEMFREWLDGLSHQEKDEDVSRNLRRLWDQTGYLKTGRKLSREEMNER